MGALKSDPPDCPSSVQPLLDVQVGRGLVEHEDVGLLDADHGAGEALKLTARQVLHVATFDLVRVDTLLS